MPEKHWCFQIINHAKEEDRQLLFIHEVHYHRTGEISHISQDPVVPFGQDKDTLLQDIDAMKECVDKEILRYADVKEKVKQIFIINKE